MVIEDKPKSRWKHFTEEEVENLDYEFTDALDRARDISDTPYIITSGFRDPVRNKKVGGVENGSHTEGVAVDLRVKNSNVRYKILKGLLSIGFSRLGIYINAGGTGHIHVDASTSLPQNVCWTGKSK